MLKLSFVMTKLENLPVLLIFSDGFSASTLKLKSPAELLSGNSEINIIEVLSSKMRFPIFRELSSGIKVLKYFGNASDNS